MKKRNHWSVIMALVLGVTFVALSSDAEGRVNLIDTGAVSIERETTRGASFHGVSAYEEQGLFVVAGNVNRPKTTPGLVGGHVDVTVINPDGKVLDKIVTQYTPKVLLRESHSGSKFSASFASIPPKGSRVKVSIHSGKH